jgi:hypothetical protein
MYHAHCGHRRRRPRRRLQFESFRCDPPHLSSVGLGDQHHHKREGDVTVVAVIILMPHILKGGWCVRNLQRNFGPSGYESPRVLRWRLELGQWGPKGVHVGVKRINGRVIKSRGKMLVKFAVQWDHEGTFFRGYFFPPDVAAVDDIVESVGVCGDSFYDEDGRK